jgi:glycerate kinase
MIRGVPASADSPPLDLRPVLVAPDAFKGTFSAGEVAGALAEGLRAEGLPVDRCPLADGGEGTAEVLRGALGGERRAVLVTGSLGDPIQAEFTLLADGVTAVVEMASANGLALLDEGARDPLRATTYGTGELIVAAAQALTDGSQASAAGGGRAGGASAPRVLVACGGSATVDGGAGALAAIEAGGGLDGVGLACLCDVQAAWEDCAARFGPQKGASDDDVRVLAERLAELGRELPRDPTGVALTGAAGGLSGGLWAAHGAELLRGAQYVVGVLGVDARMRASRCVVVGEGRLDRTTLDGKAPGELATRARQAGVPCHAVAGTVAIDPFDARILDLMELIEAGTLDELREAGSELGRRILRAAR